MFLQVLFSIFAVIAAATNDICFEGGACATKSSALLQVSARETLLTSIWPFSSSCDKDTQVSCSTGLLGTTTKCFSKDVGCPVSCGDDEYKCFTPRTSDNGVAKSYCSKFPCAETCKPTELGCPLSNGSFTCVGRRDGCPVSCGKNELTCHTPPTCKGCVGTNYCSPKQCPVRCGRGELKCTRSDGTDYCGRADLGCPTNCGPKQFVCHSPAVCKDCVGTNWCSSSPCPLICNSTQISCLNDDGSNSCKPLAEGCPVKCKKHHHLCHSPPTCRGCKGSNWCSSTSCPVWCASNEVSCARKDGSTFCTPAKKGCPVSCSKNEYTCKAPQTLTGSQGHTYCSSTPCPAVCSAEEQVCPQGVGKPSVCAPKKVGCNVTCPKGEHKCHRPPLIAGGESYNYCSLSPCPPVCDANQVLCPKSDGSSKCYKKADGCPVTCSKGENQCHSPPTCKGCAGTNWCATSVCPLTCNSISEMPCKDPETGHHSCVKRTAGCPVKCKKAEFKCHAAATCRSCFASNYCASSPCPLTCKSTEVSCPKADGSNFCRLLSEGCPVECGKDLYTCRTPSQGPMPASNYCSKVKCATPQSIAVTSALKKKEKKEDKEKEKKAEKHDETKAAKVLENDAEEKAVQKAKEALKKAAKKAKKPEALKKTMKKATTKALKNLKKAEKNEEKNDEKAVKKDEKKEIKTEKKKEKKEEKKAKKQIKNLFTLAEKKKMAEKEAQTEAEEEEEEAEILAKKREAQKKAAEEAEKKLEKEEEDAEKEESVDKEDNEAEKDVEKDAEKDAEKDTEKDAEKDAKKDAKKDAEKDETERDTREDEEAEKDKIERGIRQLIND
eukprot:TRINITY_DN1143_c0_g1_i2.p1 TRINITY_DN1143_c0_g1~~TRINITY_DN1143_c0_g1_i2.p1  ORF type:complete len:833 (+),score=217.59 TRINITY_DN1143_c0_g1_i2:85-2583(+)